MKFPVPCLTDTNNFLDEIEFSDAALQTEVGKIVASGGVGGYEPETVGAAIALVVSEKIDAFVDVGANIGIFSLVMKAMFGQSISVDAFEPLPRLGKILKELSESNGLNIAIHREAASNAKGNAKFYVSAKSDSSNSLNADFRKAKEVIDVEIVTLDEFFAGREQKWLFKVDTETTEADVLEGASGLIVRSKPWFICEVLWGRNEERLQQIIDRHGYLAYHLTGEPLRQSADIVGDKTWTHRDWLFAPKPLSEQFHLHYLESQRAMKEIAGKHVAAS